MTRRTTVALAVVVLAGCELITGVDEDRLRGAIGYPDALMITVPETVQAGQEFTVTVRTFGNNSCWRKGTTEVAVSDLAATITPYDIRRTERGINCADVIVELLHTTRLSFDRPGMGEVTIRGCDGVAVESVVIE